MIGLSISRRWRGVLATPLLLSFAFLFSSSSSVAQIPSVITGQCDCDTATETIVCTYTVRSGLPALSHVILPVAENCLNRLTITSPFYEFSVPQAFTDRFCGPVFGIKGDRELPSGQTTTITVTYRTACHLGVAMVYTAAKGGAGCDILAVPGVVDCSFTPCVDWRLEGKTSDYFFKKPGVYTGESINLIVKSNCDLGVGFAGFGDIVPVDPTMSVPLPTEYATVIGCDPSPPMEFLPSEAFNATTFTIPGNEQEFPFCIWTKVTVGAEHTACEYQDDGVISLVLLNQTTWVE